MHTRTLKVQRIWWVYVGLWEQFWLSSNHDLRCLVNELTVGRSRITVVFQVWEALQENVVQRHSPFHVLCPCLLPKSCSCSSMCHIHSFIHFLFYFGAHIFSHSSLHPPWCAPLVPQLSLFSGNLSTPLPLFSSRLSVTPSVMSSFQPYLFFWLPVWDHVSVSGFCLCQSQFQCVCQFVTH